MIWQKYKAQRKLSELIKEGIDMEIDPDKMPEFPENEVLIEVKESQVTNGSVEQRPTNKHSWIGNLHDRFLTTCCFRCIFVYTVILLS